MPMDVARRYRWIYKPLVFLACLVPWAWTVAAAIGLQLPAPFGIPGLGPDPARRMLGILGHTALNLLLLTLAVSPARVLSGNAHLLRLRRMLGVFAFVYALLHFLVYVGAIQGFDGRAIYADIYKRPYITLGATALVALLALAATSTNGMMRRLGRAWQKLHRLVYLAAVLGVWHYWWQVKKDIREPLVYAALLAALLGWRLWRRGARATSRSAPPTAPGTA